MKLRNTTRTALACTFALVLMGPPVCAFAQQAPQGTVTRKSEKADLKNLEQNGYKPEAQDAHYPDDIQAAEKKAYGGAPASGPAAK